MTIAFKKQKIKIPLHQSSSVLGLAQANENLSIDVMKLLFGLLIYNPSALNNILCRTPCLLLVIEKNETKGLSQLPVLAKLPGS